MNRRQFTGTSPLALLLTSYPCLPVQALTLTEVTQVQTAQALKATLERGAINAITSLSRLNGYLGNEKVRIPLPGFLGDGAKMFKALGQGKRLDELTIAMNRAAETAVPLAKDMFLGAIRSMTIIDAKKIISGGDVSITLFFSEKTRDPLAIKFLPVVSKATEKVGLAEKYNQIATRAASLGIVKRQDANIEQYVTMKALDGLYMLIGEEERKIRRDPARTGSELLTKVFGALK